MFHILQIDYSVPSGYYTRVILLDSFENKEKAEEKFKSYKGYTGPHFCVLLELDEHPDTSSVIITFGKYKGESLSKVPADYLAWLYVKNVLTNNNVKAALLDAAKATREEIDRHNQQESDWMRWREEREREQREYYRTHRFELM